MQIYASNEFREVFKPEPNKAPEWLLATVGAGVEGQVPSALKF